MKKIAVGLVLIFLDLYVGIKGLQISFIPDFIGCYIIKLGIEELAEYNNEIRKAKGIAYGMTCYSFVMYMLNLVGAASTEDPVGRVVYLIFSIVDVAILLYVLLIITKGIIEIEKDCRKDIGAQALKSTLDVFIVSNIAMYLGSIITVYVSLFGKVLPIIVLVVFVTNIVVIYRTYKTSELIEINEKFIVKKGKR